MTITDLKVKIFTDGADRTSMFEMNEKPWVAGFTTNPTLMRKVGITDYEAFAKDVLAHIKDKPISFEVFADEFNEMERQAKKIVGWGENIYVKIPVTNTKGEPSLDLISRLSGDGVKLNVTAVFTLEQVRRIVSAFSGTTPGIISVFAGRIADTGRDPIPLMKEAKAALSGKPHLELLWASPRELLNIFHAEEAGTDIITVTPDVLKKLSKIGFSLDEFSLETVKMFYNDAKEAGYEL